MTNSKKTQRRKSPRKNAHENTPYGGGLSGDPSSVLAVLLENKEKAQADRAEFQAKVMNGDLILKTAVTSIVGNVFSTYRAQVVCIDDALSDVIAAVFNVSEQVHKIRKTMSVSVYGMMRELQEQLTAFIERN